VSDAPEAIFEHPHVELRDQSPFVIGSPVPVRRIWDWHRRGIPIATLMARYASLGPAKVLSALAYAYDNQALVEEDLAREAAVPSPQRALPFR
jgi:uncharacterized protein (DUF433 family)